MERAHVKGDPTGGDESRTDLERVLRGPAEIGHVEVLYWLAQKKNWHTCLMTLGVSLPQKKWWHKN